MSNEENEREKLGDLPDGLARERGELNFLNDRLSGVPPDMARSNATRDAARSVGIGGPVVDYTVRGVYDSRPINGTDFYNFVHCEAAENGPESFQSLQVPAGRVAILRRVDFFEPDDGNNPLPVPSVLAASLFAADLYVTITKNGGTVLPTNMEIPGGSASSLLYLASIPISAPASVDCFIVYDEGDIIGHSHEFPTFDGGYYVGYYGNLLLKTGIPANFEVGNKGAGTPAQVVASQADLRSAPSLATRMGAVRPQPPPRPQLKRRIVPTK